MHDAPKSFGTKIAVAATPPLVATPAQEKLKLEWLQCARAFAAISVAAFHAANRITSDVGEDGFPLHVIFKNSFTGVDLFFVISGFIIAYVHGRDIGKPKRFANYAYRRTTRIYPPYWVLFLLVVPLYFVFPSAGEDYQREVPYLVGCFFLLPTPNKQVIGVAWTLVIEMIFYAMFGLAILNRRVGAIVIAAWLGAILTSAALMVDHDFLLRFFLSTRFIGFFFGAAVAWGVSHLRAERIAPYLLPAALVAFVLIPFAVLGAGGEDAPVSFSSRIAIYVGATAVLTSAVLLDRRGEKAPRVLVRIGDATYSVYLFHWLIGWIVDHGIQHFHLDRVVPAPVLFLSMLVLMLGGGYCAYLVVERPLLVLSQRVWRKWIAPSASLREQAVG